MMVVYINDGVDFGADCIASLAPNLRISGWAADVYRLAVIRAGDGKWGLQTNSSTEDCLCTVINIRPLSFFRVINL